MKIFLDDDPHRDSWVDDTWTIVRTVNEARTLLRLYGEQVDEMSFDHDLGVGPTGYDLIREIEEWAANSSWHRVPKKMNAHSANPVGRRNIQAAINSIERMRETQ